MNNSFVVGDTQSAFGRRFGINTCKPVIGLKTSIGWSIRLVQHQFVWLVNSSIGRSKSKSHVGEHELNWSELFWLIRHLVVRIVSPMMANMNSIGRSRSISFGRSTSISFGRSTSISFGRSNSKSHDGKHELNWSFDKHFIWSFDKHFNWSFTNTRNQVLLWQIKIFK